jgi:hypothetical protein
VAVRLPLPNCSTDCRSIAHPRPIRRHRVAGVSAYRLTESDKIRLSSLVLRTIPVRTTSYFDEDESGRNPANAAVKMDGRELSRRSQLHRRPYTQSSRPACGSLDFLRAYARLAGCDRVDPQQIRVSWTPLHLGGFRPWLHCPCGRRVVRLFKGPVRYQCRQCLGNPPYASQSKSTQGRLHFEACKLRLQLGGIASLTSPFPERPLGMHRKTYARLRRRAEQLEARISPRVKERTTDYPNLVHYLPPLICKPFRR